VIITYCPTYSIATITAQTPVCTAVSTSTISITSAPASLPAGSYTVTYNRSLPATTGLTSPMNITTAGVGSFTAAGLITAGLATITITNIASSTTTACSNSIITNNIFDVQVNQSPSLFTVAGGGAYCTGGTGLSVTLSGSEVGVDYQLFRGSIPGTVLPGTGNALVYPAMLTAGNYTITANSTSSGCTSSMSGNAGISVNSLPVLVAINNASPVICVGNSAVLGATGSVSATGSLVIDNLNFTPVLSVAGSNSGGGTAFSQRSSPYTAGVTTITNNNASKFMIATVVAAFSSASTNSTLTSPVVNSSAYTSLELSFRHSYTKGNEAGVSVQVSIDAGNTVWNNINTAGNIIGSNTFTTSQGGNNNFVAATFNLTPFINYTNLRVRFNFVSNFPLVGTSWWAIDDVLLNGQLLPLFSWTANTTAAVNGLPASAGSALISNKNITVNPTQTTSYTLTEQDPITGCFITGVTTINVNQNSTLGLTSAAGTEVQTVCTSNAISDVIYHIGGGGTGASITAGTLPAGLTASFNMGLFTISGSPTTPGNYAYTITTTGPCINVSLSGTLTVNSSPTLLCPANTSTNTDPGVCLASRTYIATATGFPSPTISYFIEGNLINFPYNFPPGATTVVVLAEGACAPDATCSFVVTVQDQESPVADFANLPDLTGECSVTVTSFPTATDACDGAITGTTAAPLLYNEQGSYAITWTYTDLKGNPFTQVQNVIVNDITAPVINCPAPQTFCSVATNSYQVPVLTAFDNCSISSITYQVSGATSRNGTGPNASGIFNQGVSTIVWTVTDANNNSSSCSTSVTINIPPLAPVINGIVNVCPYLGTGEEVTYTAAAPHATNYTWILPPNVVLVSGQGTSTVIVTLNNAFSVQANKQIRVKASSVCGTSAQSIFYLLTQYPSTPAAITGPANVCSLIGTGNPATYSIAPTTAAISYVWSAPAGTTITHINGSGINDVTIDVNFDNSFAGGPISVTAINGCGTSGTRTFTTQRISSSVPGLISGPTNVCANILPGGFPAAYSIAQVSGATSYTWNTPPGAVVTHSNGTGPNDVNITVQYPGGFTSGSISVSSTNGCGTSMLRSLALNRLNAATPGVIDVIQTGFCGEPAGRIYSYTISAMPANANSIQWTVPTSAGAAIMSGQGGTSIVVSYTSIAVTGNVTAQSINNCGSSTTRLAAVKLPACPVGFVKIADKNHAAGGYGFPLENEKMEVSVFPNPSTTAFSLKVLTPGIDLISIRILDMQGRELKVLTLMPGATTIIGNDLKSGSYLIEVIQGKNRITKKLLKF
ncbi:MAG: T9SS type A sorting domain-containing protein, partial [Ferruginibacter sp.]|nr:T9SS type A sorting domain-containing protein [Ferruginibacter sp.]